ncbi:hypothetical protein RI129_008569 [Pyrocoelia pectoralis]|uniref:CHK kinase-like domain-containing protein n=1 Tax=Pyrocoelia pectoralis TaxID=417401 RepID=A0AAN7V7K4_9COLE
MLLGKMSTQLTNINKSIKALVEEAFPHYKILEIKNSSENGNNFLGLIFEITISKKKEGNQLDTSYLILKTAPPRRNPGNTEIPTDLSILDWQLAHIGSPALDILFFIFISTVKDLRQRYYMQLIKSYYKSLSDFLEKLGSDPNTALPYEVLLEHLEKFAAYGLFTSILINSTNLKESDDIPDFCSSDSDDAFVMMLSVVPKRDYIHRIRDVVTDMIKYGYRFTDPLI